MRIVLTVTLGLCLLLPAAAVGRLWRDASGEKTIEGEFVTVAGGKVRLKKTDGKTVDIAFEKLSAADAQYARELAADQGIQLDGQAQQSPQVKSRTYAELEKLALRQTVAAKSLREYELFLADKSVAADEKKLATERLPYWQKMADDKMVKLGSKWVKQDTAELMQKHETRLLGEAIEIAMRNDYKQAADKLTAAAKLNPGSARPTFLLGLVNALGLKNPQAAEKNFAECVRKWGPVAADDSQTRANHVAALNNLAIVQIRQRNFDAALRNWKQASSALPGTEEIAQNLGRLLHLAEKAKTVSLPRSNQTSATELFAATMAAAQTHAFDEHVGWLFMQLAGDSPRFELPTRDSSSGRQRKTTRLEDRYCMLCNGTSQMECPVRNCARGRVPMQKTEIVSRNPVTGEPLTSTHTVRVPCEKCKGEGKVKCTSCKDGIEQGLATER